MADSKKVRCAATHNIYGYPLEPVLCECIPGDHDVAYHERLCGEDRDKMVCRGHHYAADEFHKWAIETALERRISDINTVFGDNKV